MKQCYICGQTYNVECHHIIYKSQVKPLEECKKNKIYLCGYHHRDHRAGAHFNQTLDKKLKLEFQNWLEMSLLKEEFTQEEIREILGISSKAVRGLCKLMRLKNGVYQREDIIIQCLGGKKVE